ncbi:hypothetical protein D3C81_1730260 [compost metagenome]
MDIHFNHVQAGHGFDGLLHIPLNIGCDGWNPLSVFDDNGNIDGRFSLPNLHLHALGKVLASQKLGYAAGEASAHACYPFHFDGSQTGDNLNDLRGNLDVPHVRLLIIWSYGAHMYTSQALLDVLIHYYTIWTES